MKIRPVGAEFLCGQTDRHDKAKCHFYQFCDTAQTRLKGTIRSKSNEANDFGLEDRPIVSLPHLQERLYGQWVRP